MTITVVEISGTLIAMSEVLFVFNDKHAAKKYKFGSSDEYCSVCNAHVDSMAAFTAAPPR